MIAFDFVNTLYYVEISTINYLEIIAQSATAKKATKEIGNITFQVTYIN